MRPRGSATPDHSADLALPVVVVAGIRNNNEIVPADIAIHPGVTPTMYAAKFINVVDVSQNHGSQSTCFNLLALCPREKESWEWVLNDDMVAAHKKMARLHGIDVRRFVGQRLMNLDKRKRDALDHSWRPTEVFDLKNRHRSGVEIIAARLDHQRVHPVVLSIVRNSDVRTLYRLVGGQSVPENVSLSMGNRE